MTDTLTVIGVIGTDPRSIDTTTGTAMTTFRLASAQRRYDRAAQRWVDGATNWYTVNTFNSLAGNALASLARGDRIIVTGRLTVRAWEAGGKTGTDVALTAEGIGHDLAWGTTNYSRTVGRGTTPAAPSAEPGWSEDAPASADSSASGDWGAASPGPSDVSIAPAEPSLESIDTPF
ncbi:single-strand DNA-binding protein [Rathayibacter oskolensis]|uniref:Single-strand DNA-binding protein n=1 Tax=Rathayibacter oskolensis TaxID=1891671 RepID=A0A1X7NJ90_9MICO|nr:single-stranded DNA-binding protein [Rathayibacter oskolensis]SMH37489.1 single-strand DNA-binding protein [Rathayibacter oskolensis]